MTMIDQIKNCQVCNKEFSPKKGVSYKQWSKSFWCSRSCFNSTRLGVKHTEEHKRNISLGNIGRICNEETKQKISKANTGKVRSKEANLKNSLAHLGKPSPLKGISKPNMSKEKHWAWKEDRTQIKKGDRSLNDPLQKQWRREVKDRDNWICRIADINCEGRLEAHHILDWKNYPELRYEVNNGITLCHHHHPRKMEDVVKLSLYFQELVASLD